MKKIIHSYGSVTDDLVCMGKSLLAFSDLRFDIQAIFTASFADPAAPANAFPASLSPHSQSFRAGIKTAFQVSPPAAVLRIFLPDNS